MKPLIVAATEKEIAPFLQQGPPAQADVLITGVGMVATAYHVGHHIRDQHYDLILNVGIAGAFDRSIALGTVVHVVEDTLAELGAEDGENWLSIADLGFGKSSYTSPAPVTNKHVQALPTCHGITVNTVHGHEATIQQVLARYPDVQVESMEGAAVFYAAEQANIPALQIRAISNYVEQRNREWWDIPRAVQNLNNWLTDFIRSTH